VPPLDSPGNATIGICVCSPVPIENLTSSYGQRDVSFSSRLDLGTERHESHFSEARRENLGGTSVDPESRREPAEHLEGPGAPKDENLAFAPVGVHADIAVY
jgi:hypothetical protein